MVATLPVAASWWLAGIALVTVIGFQPALSRPGRSLDMAHALHGVTALGWSLTLVGQSWLAARRRRDAHRLLAVAGVLFAFGLVSSALPMLASLATGAMANPGFRAVGLWLLASWGTVVWLIAATTEVVLHTVFRDIFGFEPVILAFHAVTFTIYAILTFFYERAKAR